MSAERRKRGSLTLNQAVRLRSHAFCVDELGPEKGQRVALTLDGRSDVFERDSETLPRDGFTSANLEASATLPSLGDF